MIPKIDSEIGISVYSTDYKGCGGKIRLQKEDFLVSEILSEKSIASIKEQEGYAVYKLKKQSIDTNHALSGVFKKTGHRLKALGLKDANAITEQYVCSMKKSKPIDKFSHSKYSLTLVGFTKKPITKKDMIGNHFTIKISEPSSDMSDFDDFNNILNFFGYQRFGSKRPVTHLVGKAILQRDFDSAVNYLLCFTSDYDSKENTDLRKKLDDRKNFSQILHELPPQMDLERTVIQELIEHGDSQKALHALPLQIRRFFVQAYQSFLFNKTLSMAKEFGEDLFSPTDGDVCFDKNNSLGKYTKGLDQYLTIHLVGYSYYKKTRFNYQISKILQDEQIQPKDFFIKEMQEVSSEGGFRRSAIVCNDTLIFDNTVEFTLSRGSFATMVMREIMKPEDPIVAGF